jgi:hypothetical protein
MHDEEEPKRKKYKKDAYFSDEEEFDDGWPKIVPTIKHVGKLTKNCISCKHEIE